MTNRPVRGLVVLPLHDANLPASLEIAVCPDASVFRLFDANDRRICGKFADNLNERHSTKQRSILDLLRRRRLYLRRREPIRVAAACSPRTSGNASFTMSRSSAGNGHAHGSEARFRACEALFLSVRLSGL
jgi:hypothetical protein